MPNKKYDWSEFTLRLPVAAPAEKVFKMWADPKMMNKWLVEDAKMKLKKNADYEWTWYGGFKDTGKILNVRKPSKIVFSFTSGSKCEVMIKKNRRGSMVILRQYNIPNNDEHKVMHLNSSNGWTFYLTNLKTYMEYGIDLRETDPDHLKAGTVLQ